MRTLFGVLAAVAFAVFLSACGRKAPTTQTFFGDTTAFALAGKSPAAVAALLGAPSVAVQVPFGEQQTFSDGQVEIVFVDGTTSLLRLKPKAKVSFSSESVPLASESFSLLGSAPQAPPTEADSQRLTWLDLPDAREVTLVSRDGRYLTAAIVDFDGRILTARKAAAQAAAPQIFSPVTVSGVPPINRDLQDECLRVLGLLKQAFNYDLSAGDPQGFVRSAAVAEAAALALQDKLSRGDPRRDLVVNAAQALQGLTTSLAAGNPPDSQEVVGIRAAASMRLGLLSAILNDDFSPGTKSLFEAWLRDSG